uniref:BTB domain-containing protein n=1 Tax=Panagrolaimus sp. ES5 TaxID=591445 RepID=A0AC34FR36_9BILA
MDFSTSRSQKGKPSKRPTFIQTLQELLDSAVDSDVTFKVKEEEFRAHKLILGMRSPRMKEMLKGLSSDDTPPSISDVNPTDFKFFLDFLYTDDCYISAANVEELLKLANTWEVPSLVDKCMAFLENQIDETNILHYAAIGFSYRDEHNLYQKCLSLLPDLLVDISFMINENNKWIPMSYELLLDIVKNCQCIPELEETLFYKIIDWAKKECQCRNLDINAENMKAVLDEIQIYINYLLLRPRTLATVVLEYQLLSFEDLLDCFCEIAIEEEKNTPKSKLVSAC